MHEHEHHAPRSLHARIRGDIEARILSGEWPAGHRIPREHELTEQYGCSRMTVSKAIAALVTDGFVIRNRKAGSFVARPRMHSAVMHFPDIQHEIEADGRSYAYRCLDIETRPACCQYLDAEGHHLGGSLFIRSIHLSDGAPLVLEERYIFLNTVPAVRTVDFHVVPPGSWLLSHVPWTEAEHKISAQLVDAATARILALSSGSPCLVVEQRTFRGADTLTQVRQTFRGDAYHLTARFGFLPAKSAMALPTVGAISPQDDAKRSLFDVFRLDHEYWLAAHRSHSSHRSHRSHTSHRSSSGSNSLPKTFYNPSPAPPQPKYVTPSPGEPSLLVPEEDQAQPQKQKILPGNSNKFQQIVKQVQLALFAYGYYVGEVDGLVGPGTKDAISKMQSDYGLKVTGTITPQVLDALKIEAR